VHVVKTSRFSYRYRDRNRIKDTERGRVEYTEREKKMGRQEEGTVRKRHRVEKRWDRGEIERGKEEYKGQPGE
jgi:hypothetical protein